MSANPGRATNEPSNYFAAGDHAFSDPTSLTNGPYFFRYLDGTGFEVDNQFDSVREGGDGQEVGLRYKKLVTSDGQWIAYARPRLAAHAWRGILGGANQSLATPGNATLLRQIIRPDLNAVNAVSVSTLPAFQFIQRHGSLLERTYWGRYTNLKLEGEAGQPLKYTAQFIAGGSVGQFGTGASAYAASYEAQDVPIFYAGGSYVLNGAASYSTDITKFTLEVARTMDDAIQTTALTRDDVVSLGLDINFDCTIKLTSAALYQDVQYNASNLISSFATGSVRLTNVYQYVDKNGGTGIHDIFVPLIEWVDAKVNKLDPDGKTVYVDLVGMSVKGATYPIWANIDTDFLTGTFAQ